MPCPGYFVRGGLCVHSPVFYTTTRPPLTLGTCLEDVAAVPFVELVKVLELGWLEWKIICCQGYPCPHYHQFSFKVLHHVTKEVVAHGMELFVGNLVLHSGLEFIAH